MLLWLRWLFVIPRTDSLVRLVLIGLHGAGGASVVQRVVLVGLHGVGGASRVKAVFHLAWFQRRSIPVLLCPV